MIELIRDKNAYLQYFKWRKYYYYSRNTQSVCELCAAINRNNSQVYENFRNWWYPALDFYDLCGNANSYTEETSNLDTHQEINYVQI